MTQSFLELDDIIRQVVEEVNKKFKEKPKVAIAGFGKTGKSSLFNAIYGENKAKVAMAKTGLNSLEFSILIDDYKENLLKWLQEGGFSIK